ncbi:MAG: DUF255 domain-containing protein [Bacteroidota bacterium]
MKAFRYAIALLLVTPLLSATTPKDDKKKEASDAIEWISFEEALERSKEEPRKILVDFYTDWCGWCKRMDAAVYGNEEIASYINEKYYAVKFNAEKDKEDIVFHGNTFSFVPPPEGGRNGIHELAYILMNKRASYPTTTFLDENLKMIQAIPGYQKPPFFDMILKYLGENEYKTTNWEEFSSSYESSL